MALAHDFLGTQLMPWRERTKHQIESVILMELGQPERSSRLSQQPLTGRGRPPSADVPYTPFHPSTIPKDIPVGLGPVRSSLP